MKLPNAASIAVIAVAASAATDAFVPSTTTAFRRSSVVVVVDMGKSQVMPGPAGKASSGPSTSEYRQNKMKKRLSKKKKGKKGGGGFSSADDLEDDADVKGGGKLMEVELVEEPEGGEEVSPIGGSDADSIRLKDLGPVDESDEASSLKDELNAPVHNFWLTAVADGDAIRKTRAIVARDASKKSNFPGFRPGQIPPYAQPQMTNFALREVMVTSCQEAIGKFGVKEINEGQLGAVTFNEDVDVISKKYDIKGCPGVPFTANFRAYFDPDVARDDATDAEGEEESAADAAADDEN